MMSFSDQVAAKARGQLLAELTTPLRAAGVHLVAGTHRMTSASEIVAIAGVDQIVAVIASLSDEPTASCSMANVVKVGKSEFTLATWRLVPAGDAAPALVPASSFNQRVSWFAIAHATSR